MNIAITSDIHNNLANLKKVLDYCAEKKISTMICCGDLASMETLDFLNDNFAGEIFYCFGNMDDGQMKIISPFGKGGSKRSEQGDLKNIQRTRELYKYKHTQIFKNHGEIKIAGESIAFVHYPDKARKLAESGKYDFVFYGHTHKPWLEKINNCIMLNPGNVANERYSPTFAIWNTENDKFELVRVNELE